MDPRLLQLLQSLSQSGQLSGPPPPGVLPQPLSYDELQALDPRDIVDLLPPSYEELQGVDPRFILDAPVELPERYDYPGLVRDKRPLPSNMFSRAMTPQPSPPARSEVGPIPPERMSQAPVARLDRAISELLPNPDIEDVAAIPYNLYRGVTYPFRQPEQELPPATPRFNPATAGPAAAPVSETAGPPDFAVAVGAENPTGEALGPPASRDPRAQEAIDATRERLKRLAEAGAQAAAPQAPPEQDTSRRDLLELGRALREGLGGNFATTLTPATQGNTQGYDLALDAENRRLNQERQNQFALQAQQQGYENEKSLLELENQLALDAAGNALPDLKTIPAGEVVKLSNVSTAIEKVDELLANWDEIKEATGPIQGRIGAIFDWAGIPYGPGAPEKANARRALKETVLQKVVEIAATTFTAKIQSNVEDIVFSVTNADQTIEAGLQRLRKEFERGLRNKLDGFVAAGYDAAFLEEKFRVKPSGTPGGSFVVRFEDGTTGPLPAKFMAEALRSGAEVLGRVE